MTELILSKLYIYPVKSARGIALTQSQLTSRGLQFDRRWMVVTPNGQFVTQRRFPKMALIAVELLSANIPPGSVSDAVLRIGAPGMPALTVSAKKSTGEHKTVDVWGDRTQAICMGEAAQRWFSRFLETPCSLVYMPEDANRLAAHGELETDSLVSFADAYPYLLISEASLDNLNQKLAASGQDRVTMERFRPNFVVSGAAVPHEEDRWATIKIGEAVFDLPKLCARCSIPNVNPQTGDYSLDRLGRRTQEPTRTLSTYRAWDKGIWFGQNCVQCNFNPSTKALSALRTGDPVEVLSWRS